MAWQSADSIYGICLPYIPAVQFLPVHDIIRFLVLLDNHAHKRVSFSYTVELQWLEHTLTSQPVHFSLTFVLPLYSRVARTLMTRLPRLFRTRS